MKKVTLTIVAVLLAVPALAHAKAGVEFSNPIEQQHPGEKQRFWTMVMHEPSDPMGGEPTAVVGARPLVAFTNERTGQVIRVRTGKTDREGLALASVTFPDRGPWTARIFVGGKPFGGPQQFQTFELAAPAPPPAKPSHSPPASDDGSGGLPAWLLTLPIAGLAALGIWWIRRRPGELGA